MWFWLTLGFVLALLQGFFLAPFAVYGLAPNLAVIFIAVTGLKLESERQVVWLAFWVGLWLDIASQQFFGLRTLSLVLFVAAILGLQQLGFELKRMIGHFTVMFFGVLGYGLILNLAVWMELNSVLINKQIIWFWLAPAFSTLIFACIGWPLIKLVMNAARKRRDI